MIRDGQGYKKVQGISIITWTAIADLWNNETFPSEEKFGLINLVSIIAKNNIIGIKPNKLRMAIFFFIISKLDFFLFKELVID